MQKSIQANYSSDVKSGPESKILEFANIFNTSLPQKLHNSTRHMVLVLFGGFPRCCSMYQFEGKLQRQTQSALPNSLSKILCLGSEMNPGP